MSAAMLSLLFPLMWTGLPARADPPLPRVEAVSPSVGPRSGGTTVDITGTDFDARSVVRFGAVPAACYQVLSPTSIRATAPAGRVGSVGVTVTSVTVTAEPPPPPPAARFRYGASALHALEVDRLTTPTGPTSGQVVTIAGTGFCRHPRVTVAFGAQAATRVTVSSDTELAAVAPPHRAGDVDVVVSAAGAGRVAIGPYRYYAAGRRADPEPVEPERRGRDWDACQTGRASPTCPGPLTTARFLHAAVVLDPASCQSDGAPPAYPCGQVLAVGGQQRFCDNVQCTPLDSVERYDPAAGTWRRTAPMAVERGEHTATLLGDGRVLVAGGHNIRPAGPDSVLSATEVYDPVAETWTPARPLAAARFGHTATRLDGPACAVATAPGWCGRVLVVGGAIREEGRAGLASAEQFDPATGTWAPAGHLTQARANHTATLLESGEVLVAGGLHEAGSGTVALGSVELFHPGTGRWRAIEPLAVARFAHTATRLDDGRVLVVGGIERAPGDGREVVLLASAEIYDPATGGWRPAALPAVGRAGHTAVLLPDGRVLVAGGGAPFVVGNRPPSRASAEAYHPGTGRWEPAGTMHHARTGATAVVLDGPACRAGHQHHSGWCGRVLVAGGGSNPDDPAFDAVPAPARGYLQEDADYTPPPLATSELWPGNGRQAADGRPRRLWDRPLGAWWPVAGVAATGTVAVLLVRRHRRSHQAPPRR